jgi:hypothetical protein
MDPLGLNRMATASETEPSLQMKALDPSAL